MIERPPPEDEDRPSPRTVVNLWTIATKPAAIDAAARAWETYAKEAEGVAEDVDTPAKALYDGVWEGTAADTFEDHRRALTQDVRDTADLARKHSGALTKAAELLRNKQSELDGALHTLLATVSGHVAGDNSSVTFYPKDDAQSKLVSDAVAKASQLRHDLDGELVTPEAAITKLRPEWDGMAQTWLATVNGVDPFTLPPEASGPFFLTDGNRVILNTGSGDDKVSVRVDPATGEQLVEVNGITYRFPAGSDITIRTGEGNDEVNVAEGTKVKLTLLGGSGDDRLHGGEGDDTILGLGGADRIFAGQGNDRASGGAGRDYLDGYRGNDILAGGEGDDVVYGLSGDDQISGGDGRDYLEGATGSDTVDGGAGDDVVSGGRDDDTLRGGGGTDHVYAGHGADAVDGGTGSDTVYAERGDRVNAGEQIVTVEIKDIGADIRIEGSDEFKERVQADLDLLRASPRGQEMLAAQDAIHGKSAGGDDNSLTIRETSGGNTAQESRWRGGFLWHDEREKYTVEYNPSKLESVDDRPPIAGLYHEFAHVYDYGNDTLAPGTYQGSDNPGVPNDEREAVGLPVDLNEDGVAEGPYDKHPKDLTENALRDELGWPDRTHY